MCHSEIHTPDAPRGRDAAAPFAIEPDSVDGLLARLVGERRPYAFFPLLGRIADLLPRAPLPVDAEPGTRPGPDPEALARALSAALERAADGVVRQNLIFQLAIALPPEAAFPRLRSLGPGGGGGDAEDALCALAFRGDPDALREFLALADRPAPVEVRRLVDLHDHEDLSKAGEREVLRAWRCIEALQGRPYFRDRDFPWPPRPPGDADALAREVLPAWLRRHEGHPGSDDMAWRLANLALDRGDPVEGARWASLSATLPDQDMARGAVTLLVSLAETSPLEGSVLAALPGPRDPDRNRGLLACIRLRRIAAERGFEEAEAEAERLADAEPRLEVSRAWRGRWAEPAPRGLDSGHAPLAPDDPLRAVEGTGVEDLELENPALLVSVRRDWPPEDGSLPVGERAAARASARLRPSAEPVRLPLGRLAFQMRCWSTVAGLRRRAESAGDAGARADLLYKAAAVLYHEPGALRPVHGLRPERDGYPHQEWARESHGLLRAGRDFEALRRDFPGVPVADRAAYSGAMALVRVAETQFLFHSDERERLLREAVASFERCARDHPSSPLAGDAARQARIWRDARPAAFGCAPAAAE